MTGAEATFHVPREECVGDFFHALVSPNLSIVNPQPVILWASERVL